MERESPLVAVYADESCLGNGREGANPGGAGVLIEFARPDGELVRRDLWVSETDTTNNRMALRSVIEAFSALSRKGRQLRVIFVSDSKYIVDGMSSWVHDWARRGWTRKQGAIENLSLWQDAVSAAAQHDVQWRWVRGHNGHAQNEYANDLAIRAAETLTTSDGLIESGFSEWLLQKEAKGKAARLEQFPTAFRADRRLPIVR